MTSQTQNTAFTETGILARTYSDDHNVSAEFDATPWFKQASIDEVVNLAACGWGGDYPADVVAEYFRDTNDDIRDMFSYLHAIRKSQACGFECHVDTNTAMAWLKGNRPEVFKKLNETCS